MFNKRPKNFRNDWFILLILATVLITACSQASTSTPTLPTAAPPTSIEELKP
jgi:hypothetical protein